MSAFDSTASRLAKLHELRDLPDDASPRQRAALETARAVELANCADDVAYWINNWVWTYNPKLVGAVDPVTGARLSPWIPFDLFPKQVELVRWIEALSDAKQDGHCKKSRDIGFTWCCGAYAMHRWLFRDGYKANFGSRKAEYVDRLGDPDSILEKCRLVYKGLPHWMRPPADKISDTSNLIINEERESVIRGEAGDDMGRGGRATDNFYDEFAFVERADGVDAASVANADCRIFGSTVNGMNNLFYRMDASDRFRPAQKFRFHWSDDPRKANGKVKLEDGTIVSWEQATRSKMEDWKFGSEYDIDYAASVEGIVIPAKWVLAAQKLRSLVHYEPPRRGVAGGDVGGGGKGKSVVVARFGALIVPPKSWGHGDTIQTANDMLDYCEGNPAKGIPAAGHDLVRADKYECEVTSLNYDSVGVGKGTQDALKRKKTKVVTRGVNTGQPPTDAKWPDGETSKEKFANLKAELWFVARARFKKSFEKVAWIEGNEREGHDWPIDECFLLPPNSAGADVGTLITQLSTVKVGPPAENGKILLESKKKMLKDGTPSPDHADSLIQTLAPTSEIEIWMKAFGVSGAGN